MKESWIVFLKGQILYYLLYLLGDQMTQIHRYEKSSLKLGKAGKHLAYPKDTDHRKKSLRERVSINAKRKVILER